MTTEIMRDSVPTILQWQTVRQPPSLNGQDIHLWYLDLRAEPGNDQAYRLVLSERQLARSERLRGATLQRRYIRTHGRCRGILSRYLGISPQAVELRYQERGKPELVHKNAPHFNLTTTGDLALLAVRANAPLGVDCEILGHNRRCLAIARKMFSAEQAGTLESLSGSELQLAFYRGWTALEAGVKVDGRGLAGAREPNPPGVIIKHSLIDGGAAICAIAGRAVPDAMDWQGLRLEQTVI